MKSLLAAVAFCTRIPVRVPFSAEDVGTAARWFPFIGALLGLCNWGIAEALRPVLPAAVIGVVVVAFEALVTGALHFDGLADTLDGFGGGKTRDDILRIMRDHAIGTYGAMALILLVALKVTAVMTLVEQHRLFPMVLLAPALGRWNVVLLSWWLPYARPSQAVSRNIGRREMIWATSLTTVLVALTGSWRGCVCWAASALCAVLFGRFCRNRIGGVTGDTLGASEQMGESMVLLAGVALR
jgi:cobalamin 5'-phosphate synthase/cobalamin synthase